QRRAVMHGRSLAAAVGTESGIVLQFENSSEDFGWPGVGVWRREEQFAVSPFVESTETANRHVDPEIGIDGSVAHADLERAYRRIRIEEQHEACAVDESGYVGRIGDDLRSDLQAANTGRRPGGDAAPIEGDG